jgi:hypothetical protein
MSDTKVRRLLPWIAALVGLLLIGGLLGLLVNLPAFDDGLRHFTMGRLMAERGIFGIPGWSQWFTGGYLHQHVVDPWFLSDILYIPFTGLPIVPGLKLFTLSAIACLLLAFGLCLKEFRVPPTVSAVLILLLLFGHQDFTHRLIAARPFVVMTAVSLFLLWSVLRSMHWLTVPLMAALVLLSHLFVFPLLICAAGCAWHLFGKRTCDAAMLGAVAVLGAVIGFAVHPAGMEYLHYIGTAFFAIPFLPDRSMELRGGFGEGALIYFFVMLLLLARVRVRFPDGRKDGALLLEWLALLFFLLFFVWVRSVDFLWPLLLLLIGVRIADESLREMGRQTAVLAVCLCAITFTVLSVKLARTDADRSLEPYRLAMSNVETDATILNPDWYTFAPLVAVRPDARYATGIDPAFTSLTDPQAYALITKELPTQEWLTSLLQVYPSDYVFLPVQRHQTLVDTLRSAGMTDVSGDPSIAVFRVQ